MALPQQNLFIAVKVHKSRIVVQQPHVIARYNQFMGGTDIMDQRVTKYPIKIGGRKWWYALFKWGIHVDAAMSIGHYYP